MRCHIVCIGWLVLYGSFVGTNNLHWSEQPHAILESQALSIVCSIWNRWICEFGLNVFFRPDLIAINKWPRNSPCTTLLQTITSLKQNLIGHTKIKSIFARHHHPPPTEALQSNTNIWKNNSLDTIYLYYIYMCIYIYIFILYLYVYIYIYQKAAAAIWEWHPSRENIVRNFVFLSTSISTPRPKKTNLILSKPKRLRRQSRHEGYRPSAIMQA